MGCYPLHSPLPSTRPSYERLPHPDVSIPSTPVCSRLPKAPHALLHCLAILKTWEFFCAPKTQEVQPGSSNLRLLSPLTRSVPATAAEREVDDASRKGHKEPVALRVQLQPYDPPRSSEGPLPTAPNLMP